MDASRDSWLRRPFLVGVVLIALVGLVVLAAHGHVATGGGTREKLSGGVIDTLISALLAIYVLGAIVFFAALVWSRGEWSRRYGVVQRKAAHRVRPALVLVLLALLLVSGDRLRGRFHLAGPRTPTMQTTLGTNASGTKQKANEKNRARFRIIPFLAVLGGLGAAGAALYLSSRRMRRPPQEPLPAALAAELEETLRDLRAEEDPRRAVIAAYARMERLLGESGLPRHPFEAPLEYMSRVLLDLGGGARSVRAITHLFERARFSPHTIDATMKEEAIVAVEALQADLERAEAEAEAAA
ncbi:MAG: DUF4129 domain-containing protein [Actinomycetota bacterium]|nr:DUF4129 domain-containing protein [Actinomycetota bacterium]